MVGTTLEHLQMSKPYLKVIELRQGGMGLSTSSDPDIRRNHGMYNLRTIRYATQKDIDWVRCMGGHVPSVYSLRRPKDAP
jgi:hypothetical protein